MSPSEISANPWRSAGSTSASSEPIQRIKYIINDYDKLNSSRATPTLEFQLDRELLETSDTFILLFADEVQQALQHVRLKYVFSGCILVGFEIDTAQVRTVQDKVDEGVLDELAHVFDFSAVTFFKCDTACHRVAFR